MEGILDVSDGFFFFDFYSIIIDAAVRRHRAQKAFLRATAALRWMNARAAILQGQRAQEAHEPALLQIREALRTVSSPTFSRSSMQVACFRDSTASYPELTTSATRSYRESPTNKLIFRSAPPMPALANGCKKIRRYRPCSA